MNKTENSTYRLNSISTKSDSFGIPELFKDPLIRFSIATCLLGFGAFIVWSTTAQMAEGVTTFGQIIVEEKKKIIQHLEGGIISKLHVAEGDFVAKGDKLLELQTVNLETQEDQLTKEEATLLATVERLSALMKGVDALTLSSKGQWSVRSRDQRSIEQTQQGLFLQQILAHKADQDMLAARRASLVSGQDERQTELSALRDSIQSVTEEIKTKEIMVAQKLARRDELQRLRRERSSLMVQKAQLQGSQAENAARVLEIGSEINQLDAKFTEALSAELLDTKMRLGAISEQIIAVRDSINRAIVYAPVGGEILNMRFATIAGVVQSGEAILEIVPPVDGLWATVNITPSDREAVYPGLAVRGRLAGFKSWSVPPIDGEVITVSADLKQNQVTGESYYEAKVAFNANTVATGSIRFVSPGMPVEAFIDSGYRRTLLDYLVEPLRAHIGRGLATG